MNEYEYSIEPNVEVVTIEHELTDQEKLMRAYIRLNKKLDELIEKRRIKKSG